MSEEVVSKNIVVQETKSWSWLDAIYAFINGLAPAARMAFVSAVPLLVIGAGYLFIETLRLRRELTELQAASQSQQNLHQQALEDERHRNEELKCATQSGKATTRAN